MMIEQVVIRMIQKTNFFKSIAAHKDRRLANDVVTHQIFHAPVVKSLVVKRVAVGIHRDGVAKNHAHARMRLKRFYGFGDGIGKVNVIGVEPGHNIAASAFEALVDGIGLTAIGFRDPPGKAVGIFFDDFHAAIIRSAIHNDIFDIGIILRQHRADGVFQELGLVIRGGYYGYKWFHGGREARSREYFSTSCSLLLYSLSQIKNSVAFVLNNQRIVVIHQF